MSEQDLERALQQGTINAVTLTVRLLPIPRKFQLPQPDDSNS